MAAVDPARISQKFVERVADRASTDGNATFRSAAIEEGSFPSVAPSGDNSRSAGVDRVIKTPTGTSTAITSVPIISSAWRHPKFRISAVHNGGDATPPRPKPKHA